MYFIDTETCGLHGMAVLIQWAKDEGEVHLHNVWTTPIIDTIRLIENFVDEGVCGFNLAFDWFHLCKLYTIFSKYHNLDAYPEDIITELAILEPEGRDGPCLKPRHALDLMLHARKGPYQSTMERNDIRIKRVPTQLAFKLAAELEKRIPFNPIYFERKQNKDERWKVVDIKDDMEDIDPDFKDIVLTFAPSSALKALYADAFNIKDVTKFKDVELNKAFRPIECGWAPFALAIGNQNNWKGTWPDVIQHHITHWSYNEIARTYAANDVIYTRELYHFFSDPDPDDVDSTLACLVASVRWHGYMVDFNKIDEIERGIKDSINDLPKSLATAPHIAKKYLASKMTESEQITLKEGTGKLILQSIAKWESDDGGIHPAAQAAITILNARQGLKKLELFDKLRQAGRFHASFKVIGTLSSRMAGADGLNPQGISHDETIRGCFTLSWGDTELDGGDFDSFEVSISDAKYNDPLLHADLLSGKKIHALFAQSVYTDYTYDEILETKGTSDDKYSAGKQGVFALIYGGEAPTLSNRLGITVDEAQAAYDDFVNRYKEVGKKRKETFNKFCSMRQPNGIGTKVEWHEPADYVESMLGFKRYFTLENRITKVLFEIANEPPKEWGSFNSVKIMRRDRLQTPQGAVRSALFAAAFNIQASNMRAAANHEIQSTGAEITKIVETKIWNIQPVGIHPWVVVPMNVHDEIMTVRKKEVKEELKKVVNEAVESFRYLIPLIAMKWKQGLKSWADK